MATISETGMIGTIDDNTDLPAYNDSSDSEDHGPVFRKIGKSKKGIFNPVFQFDVDTTFPTLSSWGNKLKNQTNQSALDEKIAQARREKRKQKELDSGEEDSDLGDLGLSKAEMKNDTIKAKTGRKKKRKRHEEEDEEEEKMTFSESVDSYDEEIIFQDMNLSRPILKGLSNMDFVKPTPIQAACIPVALLGKDICACAVTGSGKTAAFMVPILERLLYRPKTSATTRVLILLPTRELAVQVHTVARQLAKNTNIDMCLSAGGLDIKSQEAMLRLSPDVVIATPGRLIDHLHNSMSFTLNNIEILVLDEADRMLDEYFAEQMNEIIRLCSRQRQTMLFSATMSDSVQELVSASLKDPVKVFVNQNTDMALGLQQEFIRIRPNREGDREAIVASLVSRNFCDRCIVFIQTKVQAHRMHILLGLLGVNVGELHGNLSQPQRLETLKKFQDGLVDVLLATDLAARGLDIQGVKTVINFTMPSTIKHYIHRVGRTARAGKIGRSVTLVGEKERKVLKEVVKQAKTTLKSRVLSQDLISKFREKIINLEDDITGIQAQEKEESHLRSVENQMHKAEKYLNVASGEGGTNSKRVWFQSHHERKAEKDMLRLTNKLSSKEEKKKTRKVLTSEERVSNELSKAQLLGIRAAKKAMRDDPKAAKRAGDLAKKKKKKAKKMKEEKSGGFEHELADVRQSSVKKHRAGLSYKERQAAAGPGKKKAIQMGRKKKR